jgi:hypothetical protein
MTISAYAPLTTAEDIFFNLIWTPLVTAGEASLFAAIPFLNLPILGSIIKGILDELSSWIFQKVRLFIDLSAIKLVNEVHQAAYDQASIQLSQIASQKGITSEEYLTARAAAAASFSALVHFGK